MECGPRDGSESVSSSSLWARARGGGGGGLLCLAQRAAEETDPRPETRKARTWGMDRRRGPSTPLALVHARRARGIVTVAAPGGMIEMNHEVGIVRGDSGVEGQLAEVAPILEGPPLEN